MQALRVKSRTGKQGWRFRLWNPATRARTWRTFWFTARREADRARDQWLEGQERHKIGMADNSGWTMTFTEAVERFLREAPISTETRRSRLRQSFSLNELALATLADMSSKGTLTARCMALAKKRGDEYVRKTVQQPLKQLAAWAACIDLLPTNPLAAWKIIPRTSQPYRRRAFMPDEVNALIDAAQDYDQLCGHSPRQ